MGDRRRGGLGSAAVRHRVAGVCCAAGALLGVAAGSPAHADIDDLIDTVLNAATAGVDHAGGALAGFSPDAFVPGDFDPAAFIPGDIAAPEDLATALAGAAEPGAFTDPLSQLDQAFSGGDAQLSAAMHQLDESWINADPTGAADNPAESHGESFLYGGSDDHGDGDTSASAASVDGTGHSADSPSADGHSTDAQAHDGQTSDQTSGQTSDQNGNHNDGNSSGSSSNSSMPKLSAPSIPKGGSGGSGGGGNGGGGNGGGGNNSGPKNNRSAARVPGSTLPGDPYGP
ncbi:hypothetical protein KIH27_17020 [Mycobacterium sp. M1]|uniref:Uncharacterized protein n=1 Tax=Mycolicibacter acidiphilus TaxID=2835306 RepID=A0ABS5RM68_9MYCO|nr:hypothetical protein [Mycolicibacter acidiphilus]MBS9535289.1 hypothetical protein [Mycolicibacter acidiphilus]